MQQQQSEPIEKDFVKQKKGVAQLFAKPLKAREKLVIWGEKDPLINTPLRSQPGRLAACVIRDETKIHEVVAR